MNKNLYFDFATGKSARATVGVVRIGLSLIEIMIALTMTLIVLGAMMQAFQYASVKMQGGRAIMELANRVRTAESLLRSDLSNLTVEPRPYTQTTVPNGYFEYIEGPSTDSTTTNAAILANVSNIDGYIGDVDDILGMTVRSSGRAFRGRYDDDNNTATRSIIVESPLAEIVWYTTWTDLDGDVTTINLDESVRVHRRVLLIRPDLTIQPAAGTFAAAFAFLNNYQSNNDISCRIKAIPGAPVTYQVVANNLSDLAVRANRYCHLEGAFPNRLNRTYLVNRGSGEDIVLTDVAGFDLQVYSPNAVVNSRDFDGDNVVDPGDTGIDVIAEPSDPGYVYNPSIQANKLGAFVDLGYRPADMDGWFSQNPSTKSQCRYVFPTTSGPTLYELVWDTWTPDYESDGINQDGDADTDEGTDGLDNDNANGVDDTGERETLPPYAYPIRGMKVSIRLIEKGTKQVHQTSIIHSFVPE